MLSQPKLKKVILFYFKNINRVRGSGEERVYLLHCCFLLFSFVNFVTFWNVVVLFYHFFQLPPPSFITITLCFLFCCFPFYFFTFY